MYEIAPPGRISTTRNHEDRAHAEAELTPSHVPKLTVRVRFPSSVIRSREYLWSDAIFSRTIRLNGDQLRLGPIAGPGGGDGLAGQHLSCGIEDGGAGSGPAEVDDDVYASGLGSARAALRRVS